MTSVLSAENQLSSLQQPSAEIAAVNNAVNAAIQLNTPKIGTLIPNRIFVGGIPSSTTEQELKAFFSTYGSVKDTKIIVDKSGLSKGSYGFVTFETVEDAEKIIKDESEKLVFKERRLNIGPALRKQQILRQDLSGGVYYTNGSVPYTFQNGMAVFQVSGQEYPVLAPQIAYPSMLVPHQASMYMPQTQFAYQPQIAIPQHSSTSQQAMAAVSTAQALSQWQTANAMPMVSAAGQANAPVGSNTNAIHATIAAAAATAVNTSNQQWRWAAATNAPTPQSPQAGSVAPYLYSPMGNTGHEHIMYIQQSGSLTPGATSDYGTDHSGHSTSFLDTSETFSGCGTPMKTHRPPQFAMTRIMPASSMGNSGSMMPAGSMGNSGSMMKPKDCDSGLLSGSNNNINHHHFA